MPNRDPCSLTATDSRCSTLMETLYCVDNYIVGNKGEIVLKDASGNSLFTICRKKHCSSRWSLLWFVKIELARLNLYLDMGMEKQGSRSGSGFFQMFDWNAKSRKKLFSSKSNLPEQSKQKKICDRSLPMTQLHVFDEDEMIAGSSIRGSSDYSRASSVTDEDFCGTKAPGVVARLMGLDSMPTSNFSETYSSPFHDSQSLRDTHYHVKNLECSRDSQIVHLGRHKELASVRNLMVQNQKPINRPVEKFQTEILPPKSAKSIPITHHKLLSPIKSANLIPPKDAAYIMEAAARIIEPGPQANRKAKFPQVGSSSAPLRVKNLKEKVQSSQISLKSSLASQKPGETDFAKYFKAQSMDATSIDVFEHSEECSTDIKNKGKSISLALQAKANVQKREGLNSGSSRSLVHREHSVFNSNQLFKSQQNTQKITHKKPSTRSGSSVLRQNNQKQNCVNAERGKLHSKSFASNLQDGKALSVDSISVRHRNCSKTSRNSKFGTRRSGSDTRDDKREVSYSSSERVSRKKRSVDGNYQYEKNQAANNALMDKNQKLIQSNALMDQQNRWDQDTKINGTDVVSFTFTTPMKGPGCERTRETREQCNDFSENYRTKRMLLSSDCMNNLTFPGNNVNGGDTLSTLLEQKFKELTCGVEFSEHKVATVSSSASIFQDPIPGLNSLRTFKVLHDNRTKDGIHMDGVIGLGGSRFSSMNECGNRTETKMLLDCRLPSPVSVLDHSSFTESFASSDTAESSTVGGKQYTSFQAQEVFGMYSLKKLQSLELDAELSDSASSISAGTRAIKHVTTTTFAIDSGNSTGWELEYVKEILCNIELMFKDYALGRSREVINPHYFYQLESRKSCFNGHGLEAKISRKAWFDCVTECLDSRCRRYVNGGCKIWTEGLSVVRRKDRLAEEVYNEISSWSCMKDSMVDELVDEDMSGKQKRWLDFDIEAFELGILIEDRILTSLLDELVDDILIL
ncbi:unnamed protein product [Fraxinus pennsylvanica]|uniref:DUF4378 domain-containing protein n=1 Tax=Fraxinus pennsylvanica TaxID=56036 RepID=A0AAD2A749_9LAMI|nr:unnamed protein product [Fraxinus pennsylvanica]